MTGKFRVLPMLEQMCSTVDRLFVEFIGPFGQMLVEETREKWLASGNKLRTSDIDDYIALLAREIEDPAKRFEFVTRARRDAGASALHPHV